MPKIILVTLVHNRKNLVGPALQSAVNQTLQKNRWVHLVIDNASTDGADSVCEVFAKKYPNVYFERMSSNLGQQKAYNWALNEWIPNNFPELKTMAILDSDDILVPVALEKVEQTYRDHPHIGGTYSGFNIIDRKGRITVKNHAKARYVPNQLTEEGQRKLRKFFLVGNACSHLRTYSIDALKDIGGFNTDYTYATDYNIFGRLFLGGYMILRIPETLYNFRQHGNQIEGRYSAEQTKQWREMQAEFTELFNKKGLV